MKFIYEYRTSDNVRHEGTVSAASRDAAFAALKAQGIRPGSVREAPGFFNKLFGKGKRWIVIGVLGALCLVLCAVVYTQGTRYKAQGTLDSDLDSMTRRQPIGDTAIIEKGIRTGWADVFELEGERFLASFAIPGVPAGLRNTSEEEILKALDHDCRKIEKSDHHNSSLFTFHSSLESDSLEARQIRAMVEGMKDELRRFIEKKGTIVEYGQRLVQRQEQELSYYNRAKAEVEQAHKSGASAQEVEALWEKRNASLRRMGIRLVPFPEQE